MDSDTYDLEEIKAALDGLTAVDLARLRHYGRTYALGLACEADDLLSDAVAATLSGVRICPRRMAVVPFLIGAMRSIAYAVRAATIRAEKTLSLDATGTDGRPLVVPIDPEPDAETRRLAAEDISLRVAALEDLFTDDEDALLILWAYLDETPKEEIMKMCNLDHTAYNTIRRRMRRKINGRFPQGWTA